MAKLVYALNQSLDGYVDHDRFAPDPALFRHFIDDVKALSATIYGRRMYDIMRYWDDDQEEWGEDERAYAAAWRAMPKWIASRSGHPVGPNATLIEGELTAAIGALKDRYDGVIEISGPGLAGMLFEDGLIDDYVIYLHPVVLGEGRPFFVRRPPPLRLAQTERIGESVVRLTYVPA